MLNRSCYGTGIRLCFACAPSCNCAVSAVNREGIQVKLKGHKIKKRRAKEGSLGVYCRHDLRFSTGAFAAIFKCFKSCPLSHTIKWQKSQSNLIMARFLSLNNKKGISDLATHSSTETSRAPTPLLISLT